MRMSQVVQRKCLRTTLSLQRVRESRGLRTHPDRRSGWWMIRERQRLQLLSGQERETVRRTRGLGD